MNTRYLYLPLILATLFISTCSQTTEPKPPEYKDPREMTWRVDTLHYEGNIQTLMSSISACSSSDIWLCGHADGGGRMWHYNGTNWSPINLHELFIDISDYNDLYTSDCNNIFLTGMQGRAGELPLSKVIKYDGENWIDMNVPGNVELLSINGESENNIWACGRDGIIIHYDGNSYEIDTIDIPVRNGASYFLNSVVVFDNEVNINAYVHDSQRLRQSFYHITGYLNNWGVIDSMIFEGNSEIKKWGYWGFYAGDFGKFYSYGPGGIWKWNGENWEEELMLNYPIEGMYGVAEDFIIAAGQFGHVFFYDGTTWNHLSTTADTPSPILYTDAWTDGYEAVIIGYTTDGYPMKTVVWRGK